VLALVRRELVPALGADVLQDAVAEVPRLEGTPARDERHRGGDGDARVAGFELRGTYVCA
jgi:hypothetical protein